MNKAIVIGSTTTHGGKIEMGETLFKVDGKPTHLEGMKHFCPKCGIEAYAVSGGGTPNVFGSKLIVEGDKASCGATYISNQTLLSVERVGNQSAITSLANKHSSDNHANKEIFDEQFLLKLGDGELLANTPYTVAFEDGSFYRGVTDDNALTERFTTPKAEILKVYVGHIWE